MTGNDTDTITVDVKATAESFINAWKMGYFYKLINATLNEVHIALKSGNVNQALYDSTKEKAEALRYISSTTKDNALKIKANNNATELESKLKKMEIMLSKA